MNWSKVASVVGVIAAVGAVWTRFVLLEARNEVTEKVLLNLTVEVRELSGQIRSLELQLAQRGMLK